MTKENLDDDPPPCITAKYADIADRLKRAQTESEQNKKFRSTPNQITSDEE